MLIIGIMTGNSLDAADCVLADVTSAGIADKAFHSLCYPEALRKKIRGLRALFKAKGTDFASISASPLFTETLCAYTAHLVTAVNELLRHTGLERGDIAAIGLHGQTLHHMPPSVSQNGMCYTVQLGDARALADFTGIPVISDFRSDDIMNGGEGAPFAPLHLMSVARAKQYHCAYFLNAGNTGNIAVIYRDEHGEYRAQGWDSGPFNHFPDMLTQRENGAVCDFNGELGKQGNIVPSILSDYWDGAAKTETGANFFMTPPPKSSDPAHYNDVPALFDHKAPAEDRIRTAEFASALALFHSMAYVDYRIPAPEALILSGGGWKNPLCLGDFTALAHGENTDMIPANLKETCALIRERLKNAAIFSADDTGFRADATEARIFADAAYKFLHNTPFTLPSVTGVNTPTVCGALRFPHDDPSQARPDVAKLYHNAHGAYRAPDAGVSAYSDAVSRSYIAACGAAQTATSKKLSAMAVS